jgi:putative resolvase
VHISIGQASNLIGVAISTLRRWEKEGRFAPTFRTEGGHRRYRLSDIKQHFLGLSDKNPQNRKTICYARVSSYDQKEDLNRQAARLKHFCQTQSYVNYESISDLGSGLNYTIKEASTTSSERYARIVWSELS